MLYYRGLKIKQATSVRFSPEAKRLMDARAEKLGIRKAAVMEIALRRLAEQEKVK